MRSASAHRPSTEGSATRLTDRFPERDGFGPKLLMGSPVTVHLYGEDVDAAVALVVAASASASVTMPLAAMFWGRPLRQAGRPVRSPAGAADEPTRSEPRQGSGGDGTGRRLSEPPRPAAVPQAGRTARARDKRPVASAVSVRTAAQPVSIAAVGRSFRNSAPHATAKAGTTSTSAAASWLLAAGGHGQRLHAGQVALREVRRETVAQAGHDAGQHGEAGGAGVGARLNTGLTAGQAEQRRQSRHPSRRHAVRSEPVNESGAPERALQAVRI